MRKVNFLLLIGVICVLSLGALKFNGTTAGLTSASSISGVLTLNRGILSGNATSLTFSFWLWQDTWPTSGTNPNILEDSANADGNNAMFEISPSTGGACGTGHLAFGQHQSGGTYRFRHFAPPSAGAWHHYMLTMTSDASDWRAYVDGVPQTLGNCDFSVPGTQNFADAPLCVFSRGCNGSRFNAGRLAQLAIWKNVQLTANEAESLASCVEPWAIRAEQLVLYAPIGGGDIDTTAGTTWEPAGYAVLRSPTMNALAESASGFTVVDGPPQCSGVF